VELIVLTIWMAPYRRSDVPISFTSMVYAQRKKYKCSPIHLHGDAWHHFIRTRNLLITCTNHCLQHNFCVFLWNWSQGSISPTFVRQAKIRRCSSFGDQFHQLNSSREYLTKICAPVAKFVHHLHITLR